MYNGLQRYIWNSRIKIDFMRDRWALCIGASLVCISSSNLASSTVRPFDTLKKNKALKKQANNKTTRLFYPGVKD